MNDLIIRPRFYRAACLALVLFPLASKAQLAPATPAKPPLVRTIRVRAEGGQASESYVLGFVALRTGEPFSRDAVTSTVRSLYATGRFNQALVVPELDPQTGMVDLLVIVEPRPLLREIVRAGQAELIDLEHEALRVAGFSVGEPLDAAAMQRAAQALQKELRKERPFLTLTAKAETTGSGAKVVLTASESPSLKIAAITIDGASALQAKEIISGAQLKTEERGFWSHLFLGALFSPRLDPEEYRQDCNRIRDFYRARGFLDIEVLEMDAAKACLIKDVKDGTGSIEVVFKVKEGRRYTVGQLGISGNRLGTTNTAFTTEVLQKVISQPSLRRGAYPFEIDRFLTGADFATPALEAASEKLKEYYGQMGYLNTQIEVVRTPDVGTGVIAVSFKISEGERFSVRSVDIQGNTKTRATVIARELALSPGEVFDLARARVSEARLRNTQFFEEVRVTPVSTAVPNQSDLRVVVKEGSTGSVSFGAGFSTVEQLVGFVEYSEGNFDYTNPEGWYRGGGQKFRVRIQAGNVSNSFEHSFEEPSLWERDLAVGYKIERRFTGFFSANYNVVNQGVGIYARRRIWGVVEGRLAYDLRRVSVGNVTPTAPLDVRNEAGRPKTISSVTLSLIRDTRDEFNFPTTGSRLSLTEEIAGNGLGGDLSYFKTDLRAGKWFLVSPTAEQTLSVIGRAGTITGAKSILPFYERFFLGGAYDMRGFDFNKVGESATYDTANGNQPVGGLTYGFFSAEYTVKAADNLRFAAFYDYGFVNKDSAAFSLAEANSNWGVGMRILLGGSVMRLDFGFPLQTTRNPAGGADLNAGGMKFNFSFGTVF